MITFPISTGKESGCRALSSSILCWEPSLQLESLLFVANDVKALLRSPLLFLVCLLVTGCFPAHTVWKQEVLGDLWPHWGAGGQKNKSFSSLVLQTDPCSQAPCRTLPTFALTALFLPVLVLPPSPYQPPAGAFLKESSAPESSSQGLFLESPLELSSSHGFTEQTFLGYEKWNLG